MRAIATLLMAASLAAAQSAWRLPPKNEEGRDKTLAAFLVSLRKIVKTKDVAGLRRVISPDIKNGFGDDDGTAMFEKVWQLGDPGTSPVFGILDNILSLGGAFVGGPDQYCIPYLFTAFPEDIDAFTHHVVVGDSVRLRAEPSPDAKVIGTLSWDIVETLDRQADWSRVKTHDGKEGYVSTSYLYSPVAYRSCMRRNEQGEWKIATLVAGD